MNQADVPSQARALPRPVTGLIWNPVILSRPKRLTDVRSWHGHLPFAMWVVVATRPRILVELGTHKGDSYFSFCQTVQSMGLRTRCYAVDTWRGDSQAGDYAEDVFNDIQQYNNAHYAEISTLLRGTFDEALKAIKEQSVDLLHIDGFHTYQAVRHDFETWISKLSDQGIVLMHDCVVTEPGFGVWRFWSQLCRKYPNFTFHHSNGLGILAVGKNIPDGLQTVFQAGPAECSAIRHLFENAAADMLLPISQLKAPAATNPELLDRFLMDLEIDRCRVPVRNARQQRIRHAKRVFGHIRSRITHPIKKCIRDCFSQK